MRPEEAFHVTTYGFRRRATGTKVLNICIAEFGGSEPLLEPLLDLLLEPLLDLHRGAGGGGDLAIRIH